MRNVNGIYIGENRCIFYLGEDHMEQVKCCGGKVYTVAYCRCEIRGVLKAEPDCSRSQCPKIKEA